MSLLTTPDFATVLSPEISGTKLIGQIHGSFDSGCYPDLPLLPAFAFSSPSPSPLPPPTPPPERAKIRDLSYISEENILPSGCKRLRKANSESIAPTFEIFPRENRVHTTNTVQDQLWMAMDNVGQILLVAFTISTSNHQTV